MFLVNQTTKKVQIQKQSGLVSTKSSHFCANDTPIAKTLFYILILPCISNCYDPNIEGL
jgi:hypothetical protein